MVVTISGQPLTLNPVSPTSEDKADLVPVSIVHILAHSADSVRIPRHNVQPDLSTVNHHGQGIISHLQHTNN